MRALRIHGRGGPEVLQLEEVPAPAPGPGELAVRVHAFALNRADLLQCMGHYPAPPDAPQDIPGLEYAGVVEATGPRAQRWKVGDAVMGIVGGGAFAERVVVHEREALPVPAGLSLDQAAAIPEAFTTAFDALVLQAQLRSGEAVLVHAGASGVGSAALQLCRALGADAVATVRSESKGDACRELGAGAVVVVAKEAVPTFATGVKAAAARGVDVVLDLVGGTYVGQTLECVAPRARWVLVGLLGGAVAELNLGKLLQKRVQLTGTVLRSRPLEEKISVARAFERQLSPLFARKALRPVVDSVFPVEKYREAFARMGANEPVGKLVLRWGN